MESKSNHLLLINLNNISISLNSTNNYTSTIEGTSTLLQNKHHNLKTQNISPQNIFTLSFDLIQLQTLTPLNKQINLFQLYIENQLEIKVNLKLSKLFQLKSLCYFIQLDTILNKQKSSQKGYAIINTTQFNTYLKHHIQIYFISQLSYQLYQSTQSTLILGNQNNKWSFIIQNFIIETKTNTNQTFQNSQQKPIIKNLSLSSDYSYPLIDTLELPQTQQINLSQQIHKLPQYSSPKTNQTSQQQLYICHDMKGGYIEDVNTFNSIKNDSKTHNYRFNYLNHTKIFNYFSHYPITIPPKMWRQLCNKYRVLCLGTFIIQPNNLMIDQDHFVTQQFALKLIYIAKKAQFDGYLINIQVPIQNTKKLLKWLTFLTNQMNKVIPGSQIIWYDSIVMNGQIAYQNQLNLYNKPFYQVCNGIFTNYWWNQASLKTSIQNKIPQKSIYIGNDCFGRNTYGGGKYEIVNAIKKIQQIGKGQLSAALFAPGYTYEDNGQVLRSNFLQNQIKMYHGSNIQSRKIQKWRITLQGGQGWKQQDQWWVTSNQICRRQALIKITQFQGSSSNLVVYFSCFVAGTGPNYADHFKITMQLYDHKLNGVYLESIYPKIIASQKQQLIEMRMQFDCGLISDNVCVRIIQQGKDVQYWGGHYGSRFKGETIALIYQDSKRNWMRQVPIQPFILKNNYNTFFNRGQGDNFYYLGNRMQKGYSYLSDYDIPSILTLNSVSNVQISYEDSFIGGSCLKYQNTTKIIVNKFKYVTQQIKNNKFIAVLVVKNTQPIQIICNDIKSKFKRSNKNEYKQNNGWKTYIAQLSIQNKQLEFNAQIKLFNNSGLIGQFSLIKYQQQLNKQVVNNIVLKLNLSKQSKHMLPYYFDLIIESQDKQLINSIPDKLLIKIGQFSGFINIEQNHNSNHISIIFGLLTNILIQSKKGQQIQISIIDISNGQINILLKQTISNQQIKNIIKNKQIIYHFKL